jgi:inner membrane protein
MEPVTHILTGACLARTGLNRRAAYATLTMAIAAEFPDIDTLWSLRGPIAGFEHHRGITHTFLGLPFEAALIVAGIYAFHRFRLARAARLPPAPRSLQDDHIPLNRPLTAAPVHWPLLYFFALLGLLSHLLLDYTNNYGLRPFFPFNDRWYAASIVFIFDPLIFALLLGALVVPALLGLATREVSRRRHPFQGRAWAAAALLSIVGLWTLREVQHNHAVTLALEQSAPAAIAASPSSLPPPSDPTAPLPDSPAPTWLPALRALASPDPLNPFRWYTVADFGPFYQLAQADTRSATLESSHIDLPKPPPTPVILAAESSRLGRLYLDWSPMPILAAVPSSAPGITTVIFRDPRFMGHIPFLSDTGHAPLTGSVNVDAAGRIIRESMASPTIPDPDAIPDPNAGPPPRS